MPADCAHLEALGGEFADDGYSDAATSPEHYL
jgi:hypothetical protein